MLCKEIMRKQVSHVLPDAPVAEAARIMRDLGVGFVPVCGLQGDVLGVVTDRDITVRAHAEHLDIELARVSEVMSSGVIACHPNDTLETAMGLLTKHQICRLVVTEESGRLAGVLSIADLAQYGEPLHVARMMREIYGREYRFESPRSERFRRA